MAVIIAATFTFISMLVEIFMVFASIKTTQPVESLKIRIYIPRCHAVGLTLTSISLPVRTISAGTTSPNFELLL
ncbi:hypothetical protein [Psychrobacter urativorans]|uniref:hypothetical protein n=1 Tax=Psychrobacter urativorans TaxID=45610 RepID=UPI00191B2695|nr:hypothetical protein [Psychrobacter urativorans]